VTGLDERAGARAISLSLFLFFILHLLFGQISTRERACTMDRGRKAASALDESARARQSQASRNKRDGGCLEQRAIKGMMIFNTILIYCVRIRCVIGFVLLIHYSV